MKTLSKIACCLIGGSLLGWNVINFAVELPHIRLVTVSLILVGIAFSIYGLIPPKPDIDIDALDDFNFDDAGDAEDEIHTNAETC